MGFEQFLELEGQPYAGRLRRLEKKLKKELENNPRYWRFFGQFEPSSVRSFIIEYARLKAYYLLFGEQNMEQVQQTSLQFLEDAWDLLWAVRQVSLFELQCQWRAEQLELPEIEVSFDFYTWEDNIQKVPFLPPVSRGEIDLLDAFLSSDKYDPNWFQLCDWQDYEQIREADGMDEVEIPLYRFFLEYTGREFLLRLPDIRGEKERFYLELARKRDTRILLAGCSSDQRPRLHFNRISQVEEFMIKFEDPQLFHYHQACKKIRKQLPDEELLRAVYVLEEAEDTIPIESDLNWRNAVLKAGKKYQQEKIKEALQAVYVEYLYRLDAGVRMNPCRASHRCTHKHMVETLRQIILEGRLLQGEPANFNF